MSILDLIVLLAAVAAGIWGYQFGFFTAVLSVGGLFLGLYGAARLLPHVLTAASLTASGARTVAVLTLTAGAAIGFSLGLAIGGRLHRVLPLGALREADRGAGVGIAVVGVLVVLWLLIPSLAAAPGWAARATHRSAVARWVAGSLPNPPNAIEVLRRLFGGNTSPQVFSALQSGTAGSPPPASVPLSQALVSQVASSTVKVEGQACSEIIDGSGFTVAPDLVVTNAHVVAGEKQGDTSVLLPSGRQLDATVVLFDPERDLALLSVPGLGEASLPVGTGTVGASGAVFGHPNGADQLSVQPATIDQQINAVGLDLYDQHSTRRNVFVLAADLAHGDSGAPLINTSGSVVGVVFAVAAEGNGTGYALTSAELGADLAAPRVSSGVSTGPCLSG